MHTCKKHISEDSGFLLMSWKAPAKQTGEQFQDLPDVLVLASSVLEEEYRALKLHAFKDMAS